MITGFGRESNDKPRSIEVDEEMVKLFDSLVIVLLVQNKNALCLFNHCLFCKGCSKEQKEAQRFWHHAKAVLC